MIAENMRKRLSRIWDRAPFISNLRQVKLLLNRLRFVLGIAGDELNPADLFALELIRSISPKWYESILDNGEYFVESGLAFEARSVRLGYDEDTAKAAQHKKYEELNKSLPESDVVFPLLAEIFPSVADYIGQARFREFPRSQEAERERRIYHPRYFRQYFQFGVPEELYPHENFNVFLKRLPSSPDEVAELFKKEFDDLIGKDFKRWHFIHLTEMEIDDLPLEQAEGLCYGMAMSGKIWSHDAFEMFAAIRCTLTTAKRSGTKASGFLRRVIELSTSPLFTASLLGSLESDQSSFKPDAPMIEALKHEFASRMRVDYLESGRSLFDDFKDIEPNIIMFAWRKLGEKAAEDQVAYLRHELRRIDHLQTFLRTMFRVDFIDDYANLKFLINYDELAKMVNDAKDSLDPNLVQKFMERRETGT